MMMTLTARQRAHIQRVRADLVVQVKKAGLSIERRKIHGCSGYYDRERKTIVLNLLPVPGSPLPHRLDELFTVAHEFGHHRSQEQSEKVGRKVDADRTPDVLFEETRAWAQADAVLRRRGLKGAHLWLAFEIASSTSLRTTVEDFAAHWWLAEQMKRLKIRCPKCGSRALSVLGHESRRDCAITCQSCGAHTKSRRTARSLSAAFRGKRFTGLCHCDG